MEFDYTTLMYVAVAAVFIYGLYVFAKKPSVRRRAVKRLTDKDIRIGRKRYNLLNIAMILFGAAGLAMIATFIPGFNYEWLPQVYTYGLLGGVILLLIDAVR